MVALTAYLTDANATTLTTAKQVSATAPAAETSVLNSTKRLTGWGELFTVTGQAAWPALAAIGAPSGNGSLLDVTTLEGQQIIAGTWTPKVKLISVGAPTAEIHVRAYTRSSGGTYTQIGDFVLAATKLSTTFSGGAIVYSPVAQSLAAVTFNVGDKLYIDYWANITVAGGSTTGTISLYENGGANTSLVTPGYVVAPVVASIHALTLLQVGG